MTVDLARETSTILLGTLVTSTTYRLPRWRADHHRWWRHAAHPALAARYAGRRADAVLGQLS